MVHSLRLRRWQFAVAVAVVLAMFAPTTPARASLLLDGTCPETFVNLTFGSPINLESGLVASAGMGGGSSLCGSPIDISNLPFSFLNTVSFWSGSGSGTIASTCEAITVGGSYTVDFGSDLGLGSGLWHFDGSLLGGELDMEGTMGSSTFDASAELSFDPLNGANPDRALACASLASGGTKVIGYTGTFTWVDP